MFVACLVPVRTVVEKFCHASSSAAGSELSRDALGNKGIDDASCQWGMFVSSNLEFQYDMYI